MDSNSFTMRVTAVVIDDTSGKTISTTIQENNGVSYQSLVKAQGILKGYIDGLHEWGKLRAGMTSEI